MQLYMVILAVLVFICALPLNIYWFLHQPGETKALFHQLACLSLAVSSGAKPIICLMMGSQGSPSLHVPLGAVLQGVLWEEPMLEGRRTSSTCGNQVQV